MRIHIGAQDGVNARLIPALESEPIQEIAIQPHGDDGFAGGPNDLGMLPEFLVGPVYVGVGLNTLPDFGVRAAAKPIPVRAGTWLSGQRFANRHAFRAAPHARPR